MNLGFKEFVGKRHGEFVYFQIRKTTIWDWIGTLFHALELWFAGLSDWPDVLPMRTAFDVYRSLRGHYGSVEEWHKEREKLPHYTFEEIKDL